MAKFDFVKLEPEPLRPPKGLPESEYEAFRKSLIDTWWAKFGREMTDEQWQHLEPFFPGEPSWLRFCQLCSEGRATAGELATYMLESGVKFLRTGKIYWHRTELDSEACDWIEKWLGYCDREGDFPQWTDYPAWLRLKRLILAIIISSYYGTYHEDEVWWRHLADQLKMADVILFGLFSNLHILVDLGAVIKHIKPVVDELKKKGLANFLEGNTFFRELVAKRRRNKRYDDAEFKLPDLKGRKFDLVEGDTDTIFLDYKSYSAKEISDLRFIVVWLISQHYGAYELHEEGWMLRTLRGAKGPILITRFPVSDCDVGDEIANRIIESAYIGCGGPSVTNSMMGATGLGRESPPELSIDDAISKDQFETIMNRGAVDLRIMDPSVCLSLYSEKLFLEPDPFPLLRRLCDRSTLEIPQFPQISFPNSESPVVNLDKVPASAVAFILQGESARDTFTLHTGAATILSYTQPDVIKRSGEMKLFLAAPSPAAFFRLVFGDVTPPIFSQSLVGLELLRAAQVTAALRLQDAASEDPTIKIEFNNLVKFLEIGLSQLYSCVPELESLHLAAGSIFVCKPSRLLTLSRRMKHHKEDAHHAVQALIQNGSFTAYHVEFASSPSSKLIPPIQPPEIAIPAGKHSIYVLPPSGLTSPLFATTPIQVVLKKLSPAGKKTALLKPDGTLFVHATDDPLTNLVSRPQHFKSFNQLEVITRLANDGATSGSCHGLLIRINPTFYESSRGHLMEENSGIISRDSIASSMHPPTNGDPGSSSLPSTSSTFSSGAAPSTSAIIRPRKKRANAKVNSALAALASGSILDQPVQPREKDGKRKERDDDSDTGVAGSRPSASDHPPQQSRKRRGRPI